ncbi:hypothetical protein E3N88_20210 [Mikania micrantha]|uniref:TF-B3 domain-containing protein n=1 Tax=Mikania micrantha TaxID=192012 RepID=A0A5N6NIS8_9ASTR|nr:hypothetical protein E3N88_20210 [Mikania micrantha]
MAAAQITSERSSDLQLAVNVRKTPNSPVTDATVAQLFMSKTSPTAPLTPSSAKRKRLKPAKCHFSSINLEKKRLLSKDKAENDPTRMTLRSFLPKDDSLIVIEDENGEKYDMKFIANRFGFSGGWRKFAIVHKLLEGDVLIFELVESCKFKIYIVRTNDSKEDDGADNVVNLDAQVKHKTPGRKRLSLGSSSLPLTEVRKKYKRSKPLTQPNNHPMDHSMVNSQVQEGSPEPNLSLREVKTFKDFHIMVDNQCIDTELSEEIRMNYYNLCIGKNEILHDGIREGLYHKLVAGMIGETVSIVNMIKNCKLTTRMEEFDVWDSSLKYFELMGMKVGFLRDRVSTLAKLAFESEDSKRFVEAKEEQHRNANEIKILEAKLVELYESNRKIDDVVDDLKERAERCETEFQKKVDAPW